MNIWFDLQDTLHAGIAAFVNGERLTRPSALLYPYVDQLDFRFWSAWTDRVNHLINQVPGNTRQSPDLLLGRGTDPTNCTTVSSAIAKLASWLQDAMPNKLAGSNPASVDCLKEYDSETYQSAGEYLRPIVALQRFAAENLADLTVGVYLHGSMSTLDYVKGSSDVDALVVIKNETLRSSKPLLDLRHKLIHSQRWSYRIDYSQHHGYSVLSELDLGFFSDAQFPRLLFSYLTPLVGTGTLHISSRDDSPDPRQGCLNTAQYICAQIEHPEKLRNWYSLKLLLQSILLLPTLFLQANDISVYKRDSFRLARPYFSSEAWAIIDKATAIRNLGPQQPLVSHSVDDLIAGLPNPWLASIIHRRFRNRVNSAVWTILSNSWLAETARLTAEIKDMVYLD